jgi:integral membrane protein
MWKTPIGRLRVAGYLEGISFLVLLLIAMPLKYLAGISEAVQVVGWAHGVLFVLYMAALAVVFFRYRWPFLKGLKGFIAAFLPGGPFWFDRTLRGDEA